MIGPAQVNAGTGAAAPSLTLPRAYATLRAPSRVHPHVSATPSKPVDFEKALAELEAVVDKLEHGELPLEEALRQFEQGIALARSCQESLKVAEQKVEVLLRKNEAAEPVPFEPDE